MSADGRARDAARGEAAPPAAPSIPAAEWATAALGVALFVGMLGTLVRTAIVDAHRPPDVVVAVDTVAAVRGGWLVRVRARNAGDEPATEVTVRGTLVGATGAPPVARETTIDQLPGGSTRTGTLVFPADGAPPPAPSRLRLEVLGFREP